MNAQSSFIPVRDQLRYAVELQPTRCDSPQAFAAAATLPALAPRRIPKVLARGSLVDRYRIEDLLGIGGFAEVYRATHLMLRVPVALKIVRTSERWLVHRLVDEARCAARIEHPNVVRVRDVGRHGDLAYIVMDLVQGRSLSKTMAALGPLRPTVVTQIAIDVANGLRAGLARGVVHRDVKPGNILITADGSARLVDFGLAFMPNEATPSVEREGDLVGTRGYMAPEQLKDSRRVDFRADVYALGMTMIYALLGTRARIGADPLALGKRVPPLLSRLLSDMVDPSPEPRPRSYELLLTRLRGVRSLLERITPPA